MSFSLTFWIAVRALLGNKLRSLLTTSGIVVGVAALIATWSVSQGARLQVEEKLNQFGKDSIYLWGASRKKAGVNGGASQSVDLKVSDWRTLQSLQSLRACCPSIYCGGQLVYGAANWHADGKGTTNDYLDVLNWKLAQGRGFSEDEVRSGGTVVLLGAKVADKLFGSTDPLGRVIRIQQFPFTVVGVLQERGQSMGRTSEDDTFLIPFTTCQRRLQHTPDIHMVMASAREATNLKAVAEHMVGVLKQKNGYGRDSGEVYEFFTAEQAFKSYREGTETFTWLTLLTASVCLFVGGLGITNTMMMAVHERTREIGIRLSLGARSLDILLQFLTEAVLLSGLGGLIGVLLGVAICYEAAQLTSWTPVLSFRAIALSFGCSFMAGLISGTYPAYRASRLDPVVALRTD